MSEARYLQISFEFEGPPKIVEVKPEFDKALDWIRIAPNVWIVWSTSSPNEWYTRLKPYLGPKDHLYIFGIDNRVRQGWAQKLVWDWLDKKR
jgi:tRNA (Thr-GGU) A37 N-methylase